MMTGKMHECFREEKEKKKNILYYYYNFRTDFKGLPQTFYVKI